MAGKPGRPISGKSDGRWRERKQAKRQPGAVIRPEGARHRLGLPIDALRERPFVFDSTSKTLIAPWSRQHSSFATEQMLTAMIRVLVETGAPHGVFWVHPNRPPVPVTADDVHRWLAAWSRDRATYSVAPRHQEAA